MRPPFVRVRTYGGKLSRNSVTLGMGRRGRSVMRETSCGARQALAPLTLRGALTGK